MCWGGLAIIDITFLALAPKFLGVERCSTVDHLVGLCGTRNAFFLRGPSVSLIQIPTHDTSATAWTADMYSRRLDAERLFDVL